MMRTLSNTAFGVGNVISYTNYNPADIYISMGLVIRTAGLIWFVRGCSMVATCERTGIKGWQKGLLFIIAGIFAVNFDNSIAPSIIYLLL